MGAPTLACPEARIGPRYRDHGTLYPRTAKDRRAPKRDIGYHRTSRPQRRSAVGSGPWGLHSNRSPSRIAIRPASAASRPPATPDRLSHAPPRQPAGSFRAQRRALARGLADSRGRQRGDGRPRYPGLLVRRARRTTAHIREAAIAALAAGDTFYTQNFGIPELREAIADYVSRLQRPGAQRVAARNVAVDRLGDVGVDVLTVEALVDPGDRVVCVTPLWPNLTEIPRILGADVVRVALEFGAGGSQLDVSKLIAALTPGTRAVMINSPNNPTGWTLDRTGSGDDPRALPPPRHLDRRRRRVRAALLRRGRRPARARRPFSTWRSATTAWSAPTAFPRPG